MSSKSGPPPIVYILIVLAAIVGGRWFFSRGSLPVLDVSSNPDAPVSSTAPPSIPPAPTQVPSGTIVRVQGSTSMVTLNANLKAGFEAKFPGTQVVTEASGSGKGIEALLAGQADIAASSRPLSPDEAAQGLVEIPVDLDAIAIVVGTGNTSAASLTSEQVVGIFDGSITNWSQVGGPDLPVRAINRPPESGTREAFQSIVMVGRDFGTGPTVTTLERDATTPMLRALSNDGIGYATADQVVDQTTVRVVAIDGITPMSDSYPFARPLFYVYRTPLTPSASAFLGYAFSPEGRQQGSVEP
ncbi:MAG: phosphate ABC transporter substrate-binding protein [Geitlerinemataceae cyanobacterium]